MNSNFNFWVDIDIDKSVGEIPAGESRYDNMVFEGVASDDSLDVEGESLSPEGFDLSYFLKRGLFNLDHLTNRAKENKSRYWIGEPIDARVEGNKLIVKGRLWKKSPEARALWDKMVDMKNSDSTRKVGMSIEGKALLKDKFNPKKILKALITNIALTFNPVNFNTYCDICKGLQKQDFVDYAYSEEDAMIYKSEDFWIDKSLNLHTIEKG